MKLTYILNGVVNTIEQSNEHVEIVKIVQQNRTIVTVKAKEEITLVTATEKMNHSFDSQDQVFLNGYQSWTDTREFGMKEELKNVKKIPGFLRNAFKFDFYGDTTFYDTKKGKLHAYDLSYLEGKNPVFFGSLNYKNAYLIIEYLKKENAIQLVSDIKNRVLAKGESFTVMDYIKEASKDLGMQAYYGEMKPVTKDKLFGYTSWYNHYQNINEEIILKALDASDERFDLFQIDDGYEEFVGDWLRVDKNKFPNGLKPIVDKIHAKGMKAGVWLAPFVCETKSWVYREHKDWIAKDSNGELLFAGGNWSLDYALDMNNPEVIAYVKECLQYYIDLGFDFFKLDFLYASALSGLKGKTSAEATEMSYQLLRDVLKDKLILGCGALVSNCYQKFDFLRIGPDVSLKFDDVFYMKHMHRERISTKVTLQNTIFRSPMNGRAFLNDPDVFLLRDDNIDLSKDQKYALTKINALFGSLLMTSDNPKDYDADKTAVLNEALALFRNAKVDSYKKNGKNIDITYEVDGKKSSFTYATQKGVIING